MDNETPPGLLRYVIYQGASEDTIDLSKPVVETMLGVTDYARGGLTPDTDYCFAVRGVDQAGNEDPATHVVCAKTWMAGGVRELTILYTADVAGHIEPCG